MLSISFPICSLRTRKEGTDIRANRAGALQGEKAPTRTPQGRRQSLPALTTQPVSIKSEVRASFSGRVPDLPEVIEHANLGAPSVSLGRRTGLWAEATVVHKGWEGVGLVRPARQRGWKRDPVRGGRGRKWGMLGLKEA